MANNWEVVKDPAQADWILIGACASFVSAIDDYLGKLKTVTPLQRKLVVYGCLPKIVPGQYRDSTPGVELYIGPERPEDIEKLIPNPKTRWADLAGTGIFREEDYRNYDAGRKHLVIQHGCSATCTYCPHIIGIGPQVSRPRLEILAEAERMVADGSHILFLEGRDTGSWGVDLNPPETFPDLLEPLLEMPGSFEIYINQLGSNWALRYGEELFSLLHHTRITDIHIPIQTTSPRLLALMGRDTRVRQLEPFLRALRDAKKKLIVRTDIIIGFPTETEEELADTLTFVRELFDEVACHGFEPHPRTEIVKMGLTLFSNSVIEQRVQHAMSFFGQDSRIVAHRGGQLFESMIEREKRKTSLRMQKMICGS